MAQDCTQIVRAFYEPQCLRRRYKANGFAIDAQFVQVFQFKDGKVAKCQMYADTAKFKDSVSGIRAAGGA